MGNIVKHAASTGARIKGVHLTFPSTTIIELLSIAEIDFVFLDGEHGAFDVHEIETCCLAAERHDLTVIARVPNRAPDTIVRFLDRGVAGIVVPHVDNASDAAEVIDAAYFAPIGDRSFGAGRPDYGFGPDLRKDLLRQRNADLSIGIMLESRQSLEAAGEIARLPGVDYLSFGLNDLAQSLGVPGETTHAIVRKAVEAATEAVHAAGKRVREDFMDFAWINEVVLAGVRQLLP